MSRATYDLFYTVSGHLSRRPYNNKLQEIKSHYAIGNNCDCNVKIFFKGRLHFKVYDTDESHNTDMHVKPGKYPKWVYSKVIKKGSLALKKIVKGRYTSSCTLRNECRKRTSGTAVLLFHLLTRAARPRSEKIDLGNSSNPKHTKVRY